MDDWLRIAGDPAAAPDERLAALRALKEGSAAQDAGAIGQAAAPTGEVNNHVHTIYSFSPYTPSMAAWKARQAGLSAAGSVDHDSVGAAREMLEACAILGIGSTVGFELRVSCKASPFAGRKLNNPDSPGIAYMTIQGVPRNSIGEAAAFLEPISRARGERNRRMASSISGILVEAGLDPINYDQDVIPLSKASEGGSVTERHLLAAAAGSIMRRWSPGPALVDSLANRLHIELSAKQAAVLVAPENPHRLYDLLGLLKAGFLGRVFIQPGAEECVPVEVATAFARRIGAIPAYAYLGDVGESPTGDKKAERFEDAFLDDLLPWLVDSGFQAITYMPPRNTKAQLARIRALALRYDLMEISGVDINSSRQSFSCPEVLEPENRHLVDATWALIAHEKLSGLGLQYGLFSSDNPRAGLSLVDRVHDYARIGKAIDTRHPEDAATLERLARQEK